MNLPSIDDLNKADPNCAICKGQGWVCESHQMTPWNDGLACCGGAGAPCICNPLNKNHRHPD